MKDLCLRLLILPMLFLGPKLAEGQAPTPLRPPTSRPAGTPSPTPPPVKITILDSEPELRDLYVGIATKGAPRLPSEMWTLTHAYNSSEDVDRVLNFFGEFFTAIESNDALKVSKLGGAKGFKNRFATFLQSKDRAVKGFAAFILGASGDRSYIPQILELVNERDASFSERFAENPAFYRGRAAMALGALKAKEHTADIAKLLKSKNESDRSGATFALAELRAIEYTNEIVERLNGKEFEFEDDDSPIYFLIETKQAEKYKQQIVRAMLGKFRSEVTESAAYALAAIGTKEHSKDIAKLLSDRLRRGVAIKALALLGAKAYAAEIAKFLTSKDSLLVADAFTALGILGSKGYAPSIAKAMRIHKGDGASIAAAEALYLLGASKYYAEASQIIAFKINKRPFPMSGDFHYFVTDKVDDLRRRLEKELDAAPK